MKVPRILHYPGSKWSMADWIISHMPPHKTYLEPFFGSGAVLFNKSTSALETINDIDGDVVNLFKVIRERPEELSWAVEWTPYSRDEYYWSYETVTDDLERARRFLVRTWQAIGAKTSDRTGWRSNIQYDKAPHKIWPKQWQNVPDEIMRCCGRLKDVQIENQNAIQLLTRYKYSDVLVYADPPYLLETRSSRMYRHEIAERDETDEEAHMKLIDALDEHPGPVLLSGYNHPMYNERLKHWHREERASTADRGKPRIEVLWINPVAAGQVGQMQLF
ncbi:MAG TPA: DNA adenine methylase [Paenibacillus sp.]|uniref:DNA adenine methylase n=1 Tax=Paenibacillus TaxID=44249 RepID=UPI000BA03342|nr:MULTISPECIES: DNA adenine methylase [Paenibacillus]OZQ64346.1 DNA methyltransferase [Paenibacillus taichungensis]HBU81738.1 DNA adenine methylase [Paenibacillus sp.]